jgi:hypothetical protein
MAGPVTCITTYQRWIQYEEHPVIFDHFPAQHGAEAASFGHWAAGGGGRGEEEKEKQKKQQDAHTTRQMSFK